MSQAGRQRRDQELATDYLQARARLVRIGYAVLGSGAEAEDVVSDCWLRLVEADRRSPILDVDAWATVAVARRALDVLRSAKVRRESYVGPWLPEPMLSSLLSAADETQYADPADRVTLDDTVSYALLIALEALTPAERTAWVLHDLFGLEFAEVGRVVGRTPAAARKLATRARRHLAAGAVRTEVDSSEHLATLAAFSQAAAGGDLARLVRLLDPDIVMTVDGGGMVRAARRPVTGADNVARFVLGILAKLEAGHTYWSMAINVNGAPGLAMFRAPDAEPGTADNDETADEAETLDSVVSLTVQGGLITRIDLLRAPDKLRRIHPPTANNIIT